MPGRLGLLLAEAHRLHLALRLARHVHHVPHAFRAPLAQREVVLAAAALVAVALDGDARAGVSAQVARIRLDRLADQRRRAMAAVSLTKPSLRSPRLLSTRPGAASAVFALG